MNEMNSKKENQKEVELAKTIIGAYQPETVEDMQNALKEIFGSMFEAMLRGELKDHLGYFRNEKTGKEMTNRRNG